MKNIKQFEKFDTSELKARLAQISGINEAELSHWLTYDDYKYGKPKKAVEDLIKALDEFTKKAKAALDEAGDALSPGIKAALKKDIISQIEKIK